VPAKMPKDVEKLQELINPITISKVAGDLIYKTQGLYTVVSKLMSLHTSLADNVYLARTQGDIVERRRQAMISLAKHDAEEKAKQLKREEEDAIAAAMKASLEEAAGVKTKSKKRPRGG